MWKEGQAQKIAFNNFFASYPCINLADYMYVGTYAGYDYFKSITTRKILKAEEK